MYIIPYNRGIVQVSSRSDRHLKGQKVSQNPPKPEVFSLPMVESHVLFDQGLNVFPQPLGKKGGYPWRALRYTRLARDSKKASLREAFLGNCNLAVMCGRTSGDLFVIDCETPKALSHHMEQLRKRSIPLWVVKTARGGHIYLRSTRGEVESIPAGVIPDVEIRGAGGYVLAPPSLHPSGVCYEWLVREGSSIPQVDPARIDWLFTAKRNAVDLTVRPKRRKLQVIALSPNSALSKATRDYIARGAALPEGTRNNRLFAAACDMLGCSYAAIEVEAILKPIALASGLSLYEVEATLASASSQTRTPSRPQSIHHKHDDRYSWRLAMLYATLHRWDGPTASQERALFLAMIERHRLGGNERGVFRASIRELAAMARMGINTVQRILRRWQQLGQPIIFHVGSDQTSGAHTWRFADRVYQHARRFLANNPDHLIPAHWLHYSEALFTSDVVERGGVGKSAMFLYSFMQQLNRAAFPSELARLSNLSINQVNYGLAKLRELGLVQRTTTGWCCIGMSLSALTQHVVEQRPAIAGRGERRRRTFAEQRSAYVTRQIVCARMNREGQKLRLLLRETLPIILSREMICDEIRRTLDSPISRVLFDAGAHCQLEDGQVLRYVPLY